MTTKYEWTIRLGVDEHGDCLDVDHADSLQELVGRHGIDGHEFELYRWNRPECGFDISEWRDGALRPYGECLDAGDPGRGTPPKRFHDEASRVLG